jgi:hypothetical protein
MSRLLRRIRTGVSCITAGGSGRSFHDGSVAPEVWPSAQLGRPRVDTLKNSSHANMKELRFDADDGVWRIAFVFDPKRKAVLLVAGDKSGVSEKRFYRELIRKADQRFDAHLERISKARKAHGTERKRSH